MQKLSVIQVIDGLALMHTVMELPYQLIPHIVVYIVMLAQFINEV